MSLSLVSSLAKHLRIVFRNLRVGYLLFSLLPKFSFQNFFDRIKIWLIHLFPEAIFYPGYLFNYALGPRRFH